MQAAGFQGAQESGPERAALAVPDVEAEDFAAAVGADPGGHHHGLGGDLRAAAAAVPTDAGLGNSGRSTPDTSTPRARRTTSSVSAAFNASSFRERDPWSADDKEVIKRAWHGSWHETRSTCDAWHTPRG